MILPRHAKKSHYVCLAHPPFKNYNIWWSHSDSKYAGTALLIKKCFQPKKDFVHSGSNSHQDIDVSHPEFFSTAKLNGYVPPNSEDCGQPGFTLSERKRFGSILKEGKLVDAYRYLHKDKDMERGFSWSGNPIGKYQEKRMRIDYFIVSEKLGDIIVSCEMHGQGIELEGFHGSDHCPVSLKLSDPVATQPLPETSVS